MIHSKNIKIVTTHITEFQSKLKNKNQEAEGLTHAVNNLLLETKVISGKFYKCLDDFFN